MVSWMTDALVREITWQKCLAFVGGLGLIVFFSGIQPPSAQKWLQVLGTGDKEMTVSARDAEKTWNTWTTRAAEWQSNRAIEDDDQNWAGRQRMHSQRAPGSLWWDEKAEQHFISKLEETQFPVNCSQAHWIAHYDFVAGLMSSLHLFLLPLFFAMVRGHPLVPISNPTRHPAFDGCGPDQNKRNIQCYFNVTNCNPGDDPSRLAKILSMQRHDRFRTSWEELLMEDDEFFPQAGVTVVQTWKESSWATNVCVGSSSFSSFLEAYTYHKLNMWDGMGRHGKVGVVKGFDTNGTSRKCSGYGEEMRKRRVDMVMTSLMSSWLLNQMPNDVKLAADKIMSRYVDSSLGHPMWKPPVLAIHIRQTDKSTEDPYYMQNGIFRPMEDFPLRIKRIEEEYGFLWPSIFLISDSGSAIESLTMMLNGNDSASGNSTFTKAQKRYIMYDWTADDHLQEKYKDHTKVPPSLKHDMQVHFLATLYILQKIADHAIVTYSSNVGRFIGEIMAAKHRLAFTDPEGPFVTSLDYPWFWK